MNTFDFLWRWVLLTVVGLALGFVAGFVMGHLVLGNVMIGVGVGAGVGFFQWLLLRRLIPRSAWWIPASAIGLAVPLGLYGIAWLIWKVPFDLGLPMGFVAWAVCFLVGGALVGWLQLRVLRRRVGRTGSWVVYSAIGWCLSLFPLLIRPDLTGRLSPPLLILRNGMMSPALGGVILGAITGFALVRLLRGHP